MRFGRPTVLFDPGWLFVVAGLVLVASSALVPATYDLWIMRTQLRHLEAEAQENDRRMAAYSSFIHDLDRADPQLVRRLAAAQLNLVPRGERAILVAGTARRNPVDWVDATVTPVVAKVVPFPDSLLSRLTLGRKSLWIAGAGAMCIFLGLLSAPLRLRVPSTAILDDAAEAAGRVLRGGPAVAIAGGAGEPGAEAAFRRARAEHSAETASSATPSVRIGADHPPETDAASHGAD
jgi:hypothetical protein